MNIECLNATFALIKILKDTLDDKNQSLISNQLYEALINKFKANYIDQELKLTIISTVGNLILHLGDKLSQKSLENLLEIYIEKYIYI